MNAPTKKAARRPARTIAPHVWLFYAIEGQAATRWADDIRPGEIFFWRHDSLAYTKQLKVGDNVVVMIGTPGASGHSPGGRIIATGVLAADVTARFTDTKQDARRWPVVCLDSFQRRTIDRADVESIAGPLIPGQGAVHPLTTEALAAINERLPKAGARFLLPTDIETTNRCFQQSEHISSALERYRYIGRDEAASRLKWPPSVERRELKQYNVRSSASTSSDDEVPPTAPPVVSEPTEDGIEPPGEAPLQIDAHVPFRPDAPSESDDTLDRGPLALFLARRLHLIWCELNGCSPKPMQAGASTAPVAAAKPSEADTFIVHIDAPWGGGKTTFANFVARVLNPCKEKLSARHFLRSVAPAGASPEELSKIKLDEIFFLHPDAGDQERERWLPQARKPWIIAYYNAWRDQYVQPPWWHIFLTILTSLDAALKADTNVSNVEQHTWLRLQIWFAKFRYQIFNAKIRNQLIVVALTMLLAVIVWQSGIISWLLTSKGVSTEAKQWIDVVVAALGVGGVSIAALFSMLSQSLAPDLDFTAEHKQIGVRDPIGRFRNAFKRILTSVDRPVLLIVDDIDRCDPKTVVEVLRGFQTIIRSPRLCVLVLGDRSWIEKAHEIQHKDFTGVTVGTENTLGERFVEKIFQLSFTLPAMKPDVRDRFTRAVLGSSPDGAAATQAAADQKKVSPEVKKDTLGKIEKQLADANAAATVGQREKGVDKVKKKVSGLAAEHGISADEVDALASKLLVAAAGSDAGYQREVSNILFGLAASLPNNPRQIKRIINAFAIYETVGRLYFNYQITSDEKDGQRARRWRQLAIWTTLATEWPQTWRALAREPRFIEAAYGEDAAKRRKIRSKLLAQMPGQEAKQTAEGLLDRLTNDLALSRLLWMNPASGAQTPEPDVSNEGDMFAYIRMDADAIYEFNRIMWEPGFPTKGGPLPTRWRTHR